MTDVPSLTVERYRFDVRLKDGLRLPPYGGSMLRGAFGHALKRSVCITKVAACPDCLLYHSCVYPYVFDTPRPLHSTKMRRYETVPHPFVIEVPLGPAKLEAGQQFRFALVLSGRANDHLPFLVHAWTRAWSHGMGPARSKGEIVAVSIQGESNSDDEPIYAPNTGLSLPRLGSRTIPPAPDTERIDIVFRTPLRLQYQGRLVEARDFRFRQLYSNLLRRIAMLTYFHGDLPWETDFKGLVAAADQISVEAQELQWFDWTRYSSRQDKEMQLGGLIGKLRLRGNLRPFWPCLYLGQWVHAGKNTSFGLGQYEIAESSDPCPNCSG